MMAYLTDAYGIDRDAARLQKPRLLYNDDSRLLAALEVGCIPRVQMGTFNKEIGFLCGLKFFALNIFCGEYLQSSLQLMLQIWWKPLLWKMCQ